MNLGSGGATIGLVAEVTGLAGFTGTRSGSEHETNETIVWSEKMTLRTSYISSSKIKNVSVIYSYDEF